MTFGLECQLCSARGASEAMMSQWSTQHAPFNNDACVNNFSSFQTRCQRKPGNTAHACTGHNGNNVRWKFDFLTNILKVTRLSFYWQGIRVPTRMHLESRYIGIWYELFQNKVRLFIKACDEDENQSPTFSMDSTWHCPDSRWGDI